MTTPSRDVIRPFPLRVVEVHRKPSEALRIACSALGIVLRRARATRPPSPVAARRVMDLARSARVVLIGGPSGAGKSTLLRSMIAAARRRRERVSVVGVPCRSHDRVVLDLLTGEVADRLKLLARAGLSEASLLARTGRELSTGQRHRLALAMAMDQARRRGSTWIFADEFASTLDRTTARALAVTMARWMHSGPQRRTLVVATAHEDLIAALSPDLLVWCSLDGAFDVKRRPTAAEGVP